MKGKIMYNIIYIIIYISFLYAQQPVWGPIINISDNDSSSYFGLPTSWGIAAENFGNKVHLVWYDNKDSNWASEIYYIRSKDNGASWENPIPLTQNSSDLQESPSIAIDYFGRIHVVWNEVHGGAAYFSTIWYRSSQDSGTTWGSKIALTGAYGYFGGAMCLSTDLKNNIYVLYIHQTHPNIERYDLYLKRSLDGGNNWQPSQRLTKVTVVGATVYAASVAADTLGRVHVVFMDDSTGVRQIYYRRSTNSGGTFSPKIPLTSISSFKGSVCISTDRNNLIHVVWEDHRDGVWQIYYRNSPNGGETWGEEKRLTFTNYDTELPNIASFSDYVCLVYNARDSIYFMESYDKGRNWSSPISIGRGKGLAFPNVAVKNQDYIHVAWEDSISYPNYEVYYRGRYPVNIEEKFSNKKKIQFYSQIDSFLLKKSKIIDLSGRNREKNLKEGIYFSIYKKENKIIKVIKIK